MVKVLVSVVLASLLFIYSALPVIAAPNRILKEGDSFKLEQLDGGSVRYTGRPEKVDKIVGYTEKTEYRERGVYQTVEGIGIVSSENLSGDRIVRTPIIETGSKFKWNSSSKRTRLHNPKSLKKATDNYTEEVTAYLIERYIQGNKDLESPVKPTMDQFEVLAYQVITSAQLKDGDQIWGASPEITSKINRQFGRMGDFIWIDGVTSSGIVILPKSDYDYVYITEGPYENPRFVEIDRGRPPSGARPYYKIVGDQTYIYVDHFSAVGSAYTEGHRVLWYEPNYTINGTALPDRSKGSLYIKSTNVAGTDSGFDVGNSNTMEMGTGDYTWEWWMKWEEASPSQGMLFDGGNSGGAPGWTVYLSGATASPASLYTRIKGTGGSTGNVQTAHVLNADTWYYMVQTWDTSEGQVVMYANNVEILNWSGLGPVGNVQNAAGTFWIGTSYHPALNYSYQGYMDEIRWYTRVITAEEMTANYNEGVGRMAPSNEDSLVGWWQFEDRVGTSVLDSGPFGNTGTLVNGGYEQWAEGIVPRIPGTPGDNPGVLTYAKRLAESGNNTHLVDSEFTQVDDYWNTLQVHILETTDGLAPEGESANITDYDLSTTNITFSALTANVDAGDRFEIRNGMGIQWGGFPFGLEVRLGSMVASTDPVSSALSVTDPAVLLVPTEPATLWGGAAAADLPLYIPFSQAATSLDWEVAVLYAFMTVVVGIGTGVAVLIMSGSILGGLGMSSVSLFVGTSMGILPLWFLIVYIMVAIAWLYSARSI